MRGEEFVEANPGLTFWHRLSGHAKPLRYWVVKSTPKGPILGRLSRECSPARDREPGDDEQKYPAEMLAAGADRVAERAKRVGDGARRYDPVPRVLRSKVRRGDHEYGDRDPRDHAEEPDRTDQSARTARGNLCSCEDFGFAKHAVRNTGCNRQQTGDGEREVPKRLVHTDVYGSVRRCRAPVNTVVYGDAGRTIRPG